MLIDSHAHLEMFETDSLRAEVLQHARAAGVTMVLTIGTTLADSQKNVAIARQYPGQVRAAVGVHPHHVQETDLATLEAQLSQLAAQKYVVAIGEIGLDFYRHISPPDIQRKLFTRQLEIAVTLGLPVIIHDREAHQDVLRIVEEVDLSSVGGVFHCFSGDLAMAERVSALGLLISIAGPVTYKNAGDLPEIAANMPLDSLLVETDAPFLAPVPFRGKRNEPAHVRYTAEKIAEIRQISVEELAACTSQNFIRVFGDLG